MKRQADKRQALLAAVCADPDNDAPRLAFADWLDANGQSPWATVIRKQIARHPGALPELTDALKKEIGRDLPAGINFQIERGFPGWIQTSIDKFLEHADRLSTVAPIQTLDLSGGEIPQLAASPHLARARRLWLNVASGDSLRRLGESPYAAGLISLRLRYLTSDTDVPGLMGTPLFTHLEEFETSPCLGSPNPDAVAQAFARLGPIRLTTLRPWGILFSASAVARLARAPAAGSLTSLNLGGADVDDEAVRALSTSPHLAGLRSLGLSKTITRTAELKALLKAPVWRLRHLDVHSGRIGAPSVKALVSSPGTAELTELDLGSNPVGDSGATALAAAPAAAHLVSLDLRGCKIGDAGGRALAESPHLGNLTRLILTYNEFSDEVKQALRSRFGRGVSVH